MGQKSTQFQRCDTYATRREAWEDVLKFVPKDAQLWLPFDRDGNAKQVVESLGFRKVHHDEDGAEEAFFTHVRDGLAVGNPPYAKKQAVLERLFLNNPDRPAALLLPLGTLGRQYIRAYSRGLQVVVPRSRYNFDSRGNVPFKACWFCWNMSEHLGTDRQLIFC